MARLPPSRRLPDNLERQQIHRQGKDRRMPPICSTLGGARGISLFDFGIRASEFGHSCWIPTG